MVDDKYLKSHYSKKIHGKRYRYLNVEQKAEIDMIVRRENNDYEIQSISNSEPPKNFSAKFIDQMKGILVWK